jgi:hypothetical protein
MHYSGKLTFLLYICDGYAMHYLKLLEMKPLRTLIILRTRSFD